MSFDTIHNDVFRFSSLNGKKMSKSLAFSRIFRERRSYVGLTTFFRVDGSTLAAALNVVSTIYDICLRNRSMIVIVKEGRIILVCVNYRIAARA